MADCLFNVDRTLALMAQAERQGVNLLVFPECGLTGYTCHDLFHLQSLQRAAEKALEKVVAESASKLASRTGLVAAGSTSPAHLAISRDCVAWPLG